MGILLAFAGALFAGAVAILAKLGYTGVDSTLATALCTVVVLVFAWGLAALGGELPALAEIPARSWVFLTLSGLATGASWLCYFAALQKGDVARVAPIDKSSTILTMLLAIPILGEIPTPMGVACMVVMGAGTLLMVGVPKPGTQGGRASGGWLAAAWASAVFAALTSILTKLGVTVLDPKGETFDPEKHNAVMHIEDENLGENVVAQVFQKGFLLGDRVIRFAAVQVAN